MMEVDGDLQPTEPPAKPPNLTNPLTPMTSLSSLTRCLNLNSLSSPFLSNLPSYLADTMGKILEEPLNDENSENRLFKNAFKIRGTPDSAVKRIASSTAARRILGMAGPGRTSSPELRALNNSSPCKANNQNLECAAIFSPNAENSTPQKPRNLKSTKGRLPLEEFDPNSQDSGYGGSEDKSSRFKFVEPNGVAPRRMSMDSRSPMKSPSHSSPKRKRSNLFQSLSSGYESTDDGFNELIDMESLDAEENHMPTGLCDLISGSIVLGSADCTNEKMELDATTPETPVVSRRVNFGRRTMSLVNRIAEETPSPPSVSKVRSCLFRSPNATCSTAKLCFSDSPRDGYDATPTRKFKRPEPPTDESPILVKRSRKCTSFHDSVYKSSPPSSPESNSSPLQRSHSETEAHANIKSAIHRSTTDEDLTGDFSKQCILPLAQGQHTDLKSISAETLTKLIKGEFRDKVSDFKIVDCRYPYEYEAGHIDGALNLYTKDMIDKFLLDPMTHTPSIQPDHHKRSIIVFHCEFSWERGPNLCRALRNADRTVNARHYPALHYPEIYLLHGGYQMFFNSHKEFCSPQDYRPMRHPDNEAELRLFRSKSKSWQGEKNPRANTVHGKNLKRLGFY